MPTLAEKIAHYPCIAILRGLTPKKVNVVGHMLYKQGCRVAEVPLNKADAFVCIEKLMQTMPEDCLIGAGTVTNIGQVKKLSKLGVKLIITPNLDKAIIKCAIESGMTVVPGIATATEAFDAYNLGAKYLKLFPAVSYGVSHLKALLAVLPADVNIIPVGGVNGVNLTEWLNAGAIAVGLGNDLYQSGDEINQIEEKLAIINNAIIKR
jgi:2-dehydro-3-deoxyphosphogalactonate aldolase